MNQHLNNQYELVGYEKGMTLYNIDVKKGVFLWVRDNGEAIFSANIDGVELTYNFIYYDEESFRLVFENMKNKFMNSVDSIIATLYNK